jgi:hypothetical protein
LLGDPGFDPVLGTVQFENVENGTFPAFVAEFLFWEISDVSARCTGD